VNGGNSVNFLFVHHIDIQKNAVPSTFRCPVILDRIRVNKSHSRTSTNSPFCSVYQVSALTLSPSTAAALTHLMCQSVPLFSHSAQTIQHPSAPFAFPSMPIAEAMDSFPDTSACAP